MESVPSTSSPRTFEDIVLRYLRTHEDYDEFGNKKNVGLDFFQEFSEEYLDAVYTAGTILDDILSRVDKENKYRGTYENTLKQDHQYALFDLEHYIPEFQLDDKLLKSLRFRETLLVSNVDDPEYTPNRLHLQPKAVGGLCLDIQYVTGYQPKVRKKPDGTIWEHDIDNILERIKQELADKESTGGEPDERKAKLLKYKESLLAAREKEEKKFLIHLSSTFEVDGKQAGSNIISWVDRKFHTLEERRTEYIYTGNDENSRREKVLYFGMQNNKYYVRHTSTLPTQEIKHYYSFSKTKDLVGEGASFLLMRYLAITKYEGIFELSTMYINGDMCRNIYECKGISDTYVNGTKVQVCKIYRAIIEQCGLCHNCVVTMTTTGKIVNQEWEGCAYILNLNPLKIFSKKPTICERSHMAKVWNSDMELTSKYLDCKTEAEILMKNYIKDHPEVHEMMADYIQNILFLKPADITEFTLEYFSSFQPYETFRQFSFAAFSQGLDDDDYNTYDIDT